MASTTALQEILANTPRLEQPPVDPRIPLAGFTFNPASQLFEDSSTGYVFDPAKNVFTNLRTRHEYTYDTESRLFRPRAAALQADAVSLKGIVSGIKLPDFSPGLKQELESGTEAGQRAEHAVVKVRRQPAMAERGAWGAPPHQAQAPPQAPPVS